MFLPECEHLAAEQPELASLISSIDGQLSQTNPGAVIRPDDYASFLSADINKIQSIFDLLSESGALRSEEMIECKNCSTLSPLNTYQNAVEDEDDYECSECHQSLVKQNPNTISIYRMNPVTNKKKVEISLETSTSKFALSGDNGFDEPLSSVFLEDVFKHAPLLRYYSNDSSLRKKQPFANKRVILVLHFLRDLLPFIEGLIRLGLEPENTTLFYKDYPYPQKNPVANWLKEKGFNVFPRSNIPAFIKDLAEGENARIGKLLIIEDGGFFVPTIHRQYPQLIANTIGTVEQTTRGIMNAEDWVNENKNNDLKFPVLSIATSKLKGEYEPPYIGRAVINNIERMLPHTAMNGKKVGVMGCGAIGQKIIEWLRNNGANVVVYEPQPERKLWAQQHGIHIAGSSAEAAQGKNIVIGCSGRTSVDSSVIASLSHGSYLVSASSEQYEIDIEELQQQAKTSEDLKDDNGKLIGTDFILPPNDRRIHLLANGYPINFWGMDSMPDEASDLIMALIFLAAVELASGSYQKPGINAEAVNELADNGHYNLAGKFLELHKQG